MSTITSYLPYSNYTFTTFSTWAQAIGTALTTFGWVKDTAVNGTVNWSTLTFSPFHDPGSSGVFPAQATVTYKGAWSNASVTYSTNDIVTSAGATWICRSGYTTSSTSPTPENEVTAASTIHWVLYPFEVWKSANTPTIYLKFEYGGNASAFTQVPVVRVTVGTSDDTNGNLGTGANQQKTGAINLPNTTATLVGNLGEYLPCYFSGDSSNRFSMMMFASGEAFGQASSPLFFTIERSLDNTGAYYTTQSGAVTPYWTAIWAGYSDFQNIQSIINTTGSTWILNNVDTAMTTLCSDLSHTIAPEDGVTGSTGSGSGNASVPAFPIWPLVGWVGNPMTSAMSFKVGATATPVGSGDAPGYAEYTAEMYGVTHTYMGFRSNFQTFGGGVTTNNGLGMRFD